MKLIIFEGIPQEEIGKIYKQLREDGFLILNSRPEIIELTETERIKLGDLEIERPVELISKEDMPQTASLKTLKKKIIKQIIKKKPKTKKVRNSQIPRKRTNWTDEIINRVKEVANEKSNPEITELLIVEFGLNVAVNSVANMMWNKKIKRGKKQKRGYAAHDANLIEEQRIKSTEIMTPNMKHKKETEIRKRKGMSEEAIEIIEDSYMEHDDEELREMIADKTGAFFQTDKVKAYRESNGMARPIGWKPDGFTEEEEDE